MMPEQPVSADPQTQPAAFCTWSQVKRYGIWRFFWGGGGRTGRGGREEENRESGTHGAAGGRGRREVTNSIKGSGTKVRDSIEPGYEWEEQGCRYTEIAGKREIQGHTHRVREILLTEWERLVVKSGSS